MCIRATEGRDVHMASQEVDMKVLFSGAGDPPGGGGNRGGNGGRRGGLFSRIGGAVRRLGARFRR